jgi:N utilization substance protein B
MPARSKARKRALDILFEAEIRGEPVIGLLDERAREVTPPVSPYAAELVRGVQDHRGTIDSLLAEYAQGWTLERMPAVDRNILRIGVYELLWNAAVPDGVAISEAVVLARDLSTESSPSFVNGLLARLLKLKPSLPAGFLGETGDEPEAGDETGANEPAGDQDPSAGAREPG